MIKAKTLKSISIQIKSICHIALAVLLFSSGIVYADPGPEYLAQTMECEWSVIEDPQNPGTYINNPDDELVALAAELGNDPVKIYSWVYENIYTPKMYYGDTYIYYYYNDSRLGARCTYLNKKGNPWDTSSLLIALLRISGIPSRYVKMNSFDIVYVEAWLPLNDYRGGHSGEEKGWIPLVPWLKEYSVEEGLDAFSDYSTSGIPSNLEFDFDTYLETVNPKTALEEYEEKLQDYLSLNYPGKTLKDVPYKEEAIIKPSSILPGSLPDSELLYGETTNFVEISNANRKNITLRIKKNPGDALLLDKTIYLPEIAGKRLCLDWVDVGGGQLKPVLVINGDYENLYAEGIAIGVGEYFYINYDGGGYSEVNRPSHPAQTYMQLAFDPLAASEKTIEKLKAELKDISSDVILSDATREEFFGRMGSILTETFLYRYYQSATRTANLMHCRLTWNSLNPTFIYTFPDSIESDAESKYLLHPQWNIDAQSQGAIYKRGVDPVWQCLPWEDELFTLARGLWGYAASYNEGLIFEDWLDTPALSTIKGLMVCQDSDIEPNLQVVTLTDESQMDVLEYDSGITAEAQALNSISTELQNGAVVTTPVDMVNYEGMSVFVLLSHGATYDSYLFNLDQGASAASWVLNDYSYYDYSNVYVSSTIPSSISNSWETTYSTWDIDLGYNVYNEPASTTTEAFSYDVGDPVNMVDGEFYQDEKPDFIIKSRGNALNLNLKRKYKSRLIYNGPFGYGWSWNHAENILILEDGDLTYYNDQCMPYKLTDNGDGTYTYPPGTTFVMQKVGTEYIVTHRNLLKYYFDSNGLLIKKEDSYGNYLIFEYADTDNPERITSVKDALNQTLTFTYNSNGKIETVTDSTGRSCTYVYGSSSDSRGDADDLVAFTDLEGNTTEYHYLKDQENALNNHNMCKYILPKAYPAGDTDYLEIGYYKNDQVAYHTNAKGETFNFQYSRLNRYGETWNEEGYYRKVFFNENNDVIRVLNEDKTIEQMDYDTYHNKISHADANGVITTFSYVPDGGDAEDAAERNLYQKTIDPGGLDLTWTYKYDSSYNAHAPTEIIDPEGNIARFVYYPDGSLNKKIQAPDYAYDVEEKLVFSEGAPGFETVYSYDSYGNIDSVTDALGNTVEKQYDSQGLYPDYEFDKNGYMIDYEIYEAGNPEGMPVGTLKSVSIVPSDVPGVIKTDYEYNQYNQKRFVTDPLGNVIEYQYDKNRKPTKTIAPNGTETELVYDTARDIVSGAKVKEAIDQLGKKVYFTYDQLGNVIRKEDKNGNVTRYVYDGMSRLIEEIDPFQNSILYAYDGNGNVVKKTDKNGNDTIFIYDAANRLLMKTDPEGNVFEYAYYDDGRLKNEKHTVNSADTNPMDVVTHYDYNALGHLETKIIAEFTGGSLDDFDPAISCTDCRVFEYRYDAMGKLTKAIYPLGNYEIYEYDANRNKRFVTSFDRNGIQIKEVEYKYYADSRNLLKEVIVDGGKDGSGIGTTYQFDAAGRLVAEIDAVGNKTEYEYDEVGNVVVTLAPNGGITQHFYDDAKRKVKTIDPENYATTYRYDNNGNLVSVIDREGNETLTYYDALNRKIAVEDAMGAETLFDYDANGNVVAVNDSNGGSTLYAYDKNNRQTEMIRPMLESTAYSYDPVGNRVAVHDAKGQMVSYQYDKFGLLDYARYYDATDDLQKTVDFNYDENGNIASYDDGTTSATYTFDDLNRKTGETVYYPGFSKSFSYAYPNNWQRTFEGPDGNTLTYDYDGAQRLSSITIPGQGQITYDEYQWNRPEHVTLPGGCTKSYNYDPLMQVKTILSESSSTILSRTYQYSPEGNIEEKATEHGVYTYGYDTVYRLTSAINPTVDNETYTYDDMGNRLTSENGTIAWNYNLNNGLEDYNSVTIQYDNNGNTSQITDGALTDNFTYDEGDRLVTVEEDGEIVAEYAYDSFGRRLWKEVDSVRTYFLYSDEGLIAEYDASGLEIKTYGYILGSQWTTDPLYQKIGSTYYWYHNDHLGTPQKITEFDGTVVWSATYDSFGNANIAIETITNNLRFPGQYYDEETGLHYNWNRYYDPSTGRYLRTDPAFDGLNLYVYVRNNPLIGIDPQGLTSLYTPEIITSGSHTIDWNEIARFEYNSYLDAYNSVDLSQLPSYQAQQYQNEFDRNLEYFKWSVADTFTGDIGRIWQGEGSALDYLSAGSNLIPGGKLASMGIPLLAGALKFGDDALRFVDDVAGLASKSVRHGPMNPGPLADDIANTFRSGSYTARTVDKPTTMYRVISDAGNPTGSYWTSVKPKGPLQSVIDSALDQNWGNTATRVVKTEIPAGTKIYEGAAAAQRGLVGGGNQVYIPKVDPKWIVP